MKVQVGDCDDLATRRLRVSISQAEGGIVLFGKLREFGSLRLVCLLITLSGIVSVVGCGRRQNDTSLLTIIPGTERLYAGRGSLFVSPEEKWVTFFECDTVGTVTGLASVEIASGDRVVHNIDRLPARDCERMGRHPFSRLQAFANLRTGWLDGVLYFPNPARGAKDALLVVNNQPSIEIGKMPRGRLYLSDGPEPGTWAVAAKGRLRGREVLNGHGPVTKYTAAWCNGRFDETTYLYDRETRAIFAREPRTKAKRITRVPGGGPFYRSLPQALRVSPDETYLAYLVYLEPRIVPSPAVMDVLRVVDLTSGKDREVCRFRGVGGMLWSADGTRLYLSVGDDRVPRGVYIVNVDKAFGRGRD